MGSVYGLHIVLNAVKKHFQGFSLRQISSLTLVPKSTIHFWITRLGIAFENKQRKHNITLTKKRKRDQERDNVLHELQRFPFHTLTTLQQSLRTTLSLSSLHRIAHDLRFSFKKVSWRTVPRHIENEQVRFNDNLQYMLHSGKKVIAVDETGFISNALPFKGYSETGKRLRPLTIRSKRTKLSCVMAIDSEGFAMHDLHEGAINGDRFQNFLRRLPKMPKGSLLLLDNIGFHKSTKVRNLARTRGLTLMFSPPYSPECNPIENFFAVVKHNTRKRLLQVDESFLDNVNHAIHTSTHRCAPSFHKFFEGRNAERNPRKWVCVPTAEN